LYEREIAHIIIGGVAVAAHGYPRPTMDLDVVPDPDRINLTRLADALAELHAVPAEGDEFAAAEFPTDASSVGSSRQSTRRRRPLTQVNTSPRLQQRQTRPSERRPPLIETSRELTASAVQFSDPRKAEAAASLSPTHGS